MFHKIKIFFFGAISAVLCSSFFVCSNGYAAFLEKPQVILQRWCEKITEDFSSCKGKDIDCADPDSNALYTALKTCLTEYSKETSQLSEYDASNVLPKKKKEDELKLEPAIPEPLKDDDAGDPSGNYVRPEEIDLAKNPEDPDVSEKSKEKGDASLEGSMTSTDKDWKNPEDPDVINKDTTADASLEGSMTSTDKDWKNPEDPDVINKDTTADASNILPDPGKEDDLFNYVPADESDDFSVICRRHQNEITKYNEDVENLLWDFMARGCAQDKSWILERVEDKKFGTETHQLVKLLITYDKNTKIWKTVFHKYNDCVLVLTDGEYSLVEYIKNNKRSFDEVKKNITCKNGELIPSKKWIEKYILNSE